MLTCSSVSMHGMGVAAWISPNVKCVVALEVQVGHIEGPHAWRKRRCRIHAQAPAGRQRSKHPHQLTCVCAAAVAHRTDWDMWQPAGHSTSFNPHKASGFMSAQLVLITIQSIKTSSASGA